MTVAPRTKAGANELRFAQIMQKSTPDTPLQGKRRFSSGDVSISVDQSLEHEGVSYLIEIDSANMAKLLVGQYVLLNQLHGNEKEKSFFLVIHTFQNFNPQRTLNNLQLVNEQLYEGDGIKFGAMHINSLEQWQGNFSAFKALISLPNPSFKRDA